MLLLIFGFIVGAVLSGVATSLYAQRQVRRAQYDRAFLNARLLSLMRLVESGLIEPRSVEAAGVLNTLSDLVARDEQADIEPRQTVRAADRDLEEDDLQPLYPRS